MYFGRTTLSKFLIEQTRAPCLTSTSKAQGHGTEGNANLAALLVDVAAAIKAIAAMTAKGALGGDWGDFAQTPGGDRRLDALANEIVLRYCEWGGLLAGMASEEMAEPYVIPAEFERGRYLLLFDPLHGSAG